MIWIFKIYLKWVRKYVYISRRKNHTKESFSYLTPSGVNHLYSNSSLNSWEVVLCSVAQLCLTLCNPTDCSPPGSSVHEDSPGDRPNPGIQPRSPAVHVDKPKGKPSWEATPMLNTEYLFSKFWMAIILRYILFIFFEIYTI